MRSSFFISGMPGKNNTNLAKTHLFQAFITRFITLSEHAMIIISFTDGKSNKSPLFDNPAKSIYVGNVEIR